MVSTCAGIDCYDSMIHMCFSIMIIIIVCSGSGDFMVVISKQEVAENGGRKLTIVSEELLGKVRERLVCREQVSAGVV